MLTSDTCAAAAIIIPHLAVVGTVGVVEIKRVEKLVVRTVLDLAGREDNMTKVEED